MANALLEEGIYVIGFFYPVVPKGEARIRVQLSAGPHPRRTWTGRLPRLKRWAGTWAWWHEPARGGRGAGTCRGHGRLEVRRARLPHFVVGRRGSRARPVWPQACSTQSRSGAWSRCGTHRPTWPTCGPRSRPWKRRSECKVRWCTTCRWSRCLRTTPTAKPGRPLGHGPRRHPMGGAWSTRRGPGHHILERPPTGWAKSMPQAGWMSRLCWTR
jgi:hypothetical protein